MRFEPCISSKGDKCLTLLTNRANDDFNLTTTTYPVKSHQGGVLDDFHLTFAIFIHLLFIYFKTSLMTEEGLKRKNMARFACNCIAFIGKLHDFDFFSSEGTLSSTNIVFFSKYHTIIYIIQVSLKRLLPKAGYMVGDVWRALPLYLQRE